MSLTTCPHCGADLPRNARVCPECGSDEKTGWSDEAAASQLGLPDDNFNYEEFVKEEFHTAPPQIKPRGIAWLWWLVAIALLVGIGLLFLAFG